ncbi:MAG TPA: MarR family transcriptional regulator [Candidatus Saccharimonadales bacterium]|jgi:DNA-binding MarR family transcriptional regulator|nr:MarR family transcriptional regulator [Candidatus Saccharimonadales bacterium]
MSKEKKSKPLTAWEYVALAEFRYQLRRFLRHMEERARAEGFHPQQYQVLLAIRGLPEGQSPTIGAIAERMQLHHNSIVELIDRCEKRNFLRRTRSRDDQRLVTLAITAEGEQVLRQQASAARQEMQTIGPILAESISKLLQNKGPRSGNEKLSPQRAQKNTKARPAKAKENSGVSMPERLRGPKMRAT